MKVLLIDGENGTALKTCAAYLGQNGIETDTVILPDEVQGCVACGKCYRQSRCIFHDEVNEILDHAEQYDGLIVSSKVYYGKPDERTEKFLERLFRCDPAVWAMKPAACIVSLRTGTGQSAYEQINSYFGEMIVLTSPDYHAVRQDGEADRDVIFSLCAQMTWMLECIKTGIETGLGRPSGHVRKDLSYMR